MSAEGETVYATTPKKERKEKYKNKLIEYFNTYKNILVVGVDNIGSHHMQKARIMLRGTAQVLMGKNTIIRKVIRDEGEKNPKLLGLLPFIQGNIGFVFTNGNLTEIRDMIQEEKVAAAAKPNMFAPSDVVIPAGMTPLDPGQTSFFQAMNIATKISKGAIEIINNTTIAIKGERVSSSAVILLNKLGIKPFFFSIVSVAVYDSGSVYDAKVLDLTNDELSSRFCSSVAQIAAISLAIGIPTMASVPHSFSNALKTLVSLSLATDYVFDESKQYKDFLENPELLAAALAAAGGGGGEAKEEAAAAAPVEEEEEDEEPAADMFGGDDADY